MTRSVRLAEMIEELDGFLHKGERFYPIELAIDASELFLDDCSHHQLRAELEAWLASEDPELPLPLCEGTLCALRDLAAKEVA